MRHGQLLWDRNPTSRGPLSPVRPTSELASTRGLTRPQQPSGATIVGQTITSVNDIKRGLDAADKAKDEVVIRESLNTLQSAEDSQNHRLAMAAFDDNPNMLIQLDEGDGSAAAAEYLQKELQKADQLSKEADQSVPVAVVCAFLNGGLNDK